MSRTHRSVDMINSLLEVIFKTTDAEALCKANSEKLLLCMEMKFQVCQDLAISCKISIQNLLKHASNKVCGCITQLLMMNEDVVKVVNHFITLTFYQDYILHRSWFYLLKNDLINYEKLDKHLLKLKYDNGEPIFTLHLLKINLHILVAKIASCKLRQDEKK